MNLNTIPTYAIAPLLVEPDEVPGTIGMNPVVTA